MQPTPLTSILKHLEANHPDAYESTLLYISETNPEFFVEAIKALTAPASPPPAEEQSSDLIRDVITKARPSAAATTITKMSDDLKRLCAYCTGDRNCTSLCFLHDEAKIKAFIQGCGYSVGTKKGYMNTIFAAYSHVPNADAGLLARYETMRSMYHHKDAEQQAKRVRSKRQEDNWCTMEEIEQAYQQAPLQGKALIGCYRDVNMRNDVAMMHTLLQGPDGSLVRGGKAQPDTYLPAGLPVAKLPEKDNAFVLRRNDHGDFVGTGYLSIVDSKTRRMNYNEKRWVSHELSEQTVADMIAWLTVSPDPSWAFLHSGGEPVCANGVTALLNRTFKCLKKKISSTMLRHVYATEKHRPEKDAEDYWFTEEDHAEAHGAMHSVHQHSLYVKPKA